MQTTCSTEPSSASGRCCTISVDRPVVPKPIWNDQWSHWSNANDLFHPPNLLEYPALLRGAGGARSEGRGGECLAPPCGGEQHHPRLVAHHQQARPLPVHAPPGRLAQVGR